MQAEELAKATEEAAVLKGQLAAEKEASAAHLEGRDAAAREAARTAEAKQADMQDDLLSLQEQVPHPASAAQHTSASPAIVCTHNAKKTVCS